MDRFIQYLRDTVSEMKHVSWPTQKQATVYTVLVIVISILMAIFIAVLDFGLSRGLDWFIK